jgi:O-antigen/teichoic acid export membrane protein
MIVLRYGLYAHLGLEIGLMYRLPYYIGQKNVTRAKQVEDTTFVGWTILTFLFAAGTLIYYFFFSNPSRLLLFGAVIISFMLFTEQQSAFLNRWHTNAQKDFKSYGIISILKGLFSFIIIIPLTYFFQVKGLMLGNLIVSGLTALLWWIRTPFRPHWQISTNTLKELFYIGFPYLISVIGGVLIETVDRILILNLLGAINLGYYAITSMGGNSLYGLLTQTGTVMLPHMVEETGQHERNYFVFEKYLIKPTIYFAYLAVFMVMFLAFVIPALVEVWLPKYIPGISAFYMFVPGFFFLSIIISANNILSIIFVAQKRQIWIIIIQFCAVFIEVFFAILLVRLGWGISGVALASTISYMGYGFTILSLSSYFVIQNRRTTLQFMVEIFIPFIYGLLLVLGFMKIGNFIFQNLPLLRAICLSVLSVVFFFPLIFRINKKYSLFADLQTIPFLSRLL